LPAASLEIRRDSRPDSLSSTSSPASAIPQCFHHFGLEQQARIAFRPCRFTRLRRVSPPIARVFTGLFATLHGDEGLADLLRSAANRRVRCVSSAHPVASAPQASSSLTPSVAVHSDSQFPASKFVPPGGFPPLAAAMCLHTASVHVAVSLASSDSSCLSIRDLPDESVSSFNVVVVSRGRRPSRLCSASRSVPSNTG